MILPPLDVTLSCCAVLFLPILGIIGLICIPILSGRISRGEHHG